MPAVKSSLVHPRYKTEWIGEVTNVALDLYVQRREARGCNREDVLRFPGNPPGAIREPALAANRDPDILRGRAGCRRDKGERNPLVALPRTWWVP